MIWVQVTRVGGRYEARASAAPGGGRLRREYREEGADEVTVVTVLGRKLVASRVTDQVVKVRTSGGRWEKFSSLQKLAGRAVR